MAVKFNPFSGQLQIDEKGSGGASYIDGEVATYNDLPLDGTAPLDSAWLVRSASGVWPVSRKQAGIYIRTATGGSLRDADYTYAGTMPDVFSDAVFTLYDDASTTRTGQFNLGSITAGQNRVLTWPDGNGTIARTSDIPSTFAASAITSGVLDNARINFAAPSAIGSTTASTGAFTTLSTAPAANTSALTSTGYSLTGSNAQSLVDLAGTWNTTGTPSAIKLNVTDTASNASSLLMDLQVGGTSMFNVVKNGRSYLGGTFVQGITLMEGYTSSANARSRNVAGRSVAFGSESPSGIFMSAAYTVRWSSNAAGSGDCFANNDLILGRDSAGALAQRDGTNSQEARLYATYTSATNYQRMTVKSVKQTLSALTGASATTTGTFIPDGAVVVGVTTRVATALTGATGYTIGDGTDADRWGDITGTAIGTTSDNRDWTAGTIECFTAGGNITLTAKTSNFTAGAIEVCVFYLAGEAD